jgi:hypothetical protein
MFTTVDRALLKAEWSLRMTRGNMLGSWLACPVCFSAQDDGKHATDCDMDLGLGELGFNTQDERNKAREQIGRIEHGMEQ